MTTERIDVLAVMDELHLAVDAYQREGGHRYFKDGAYHMELSRQHYAAMELRDKLLDSRAAIEELIESDREFDKTTVDPGVFLAAHERRRAALARVGGVDG